MRLEIGRRKGSKTTPPKLREHSGNYPDVDIPHISWLLSRKKLLKTSSVFNHGAENQTVEKRTLLVVRNRDNFRLTYGLNVFDSFGTNISEEVECLLR